MRRYIPYVILTATSSNNKQIFTITSQIILATPKVRKSNRSKSKKGKTALIIEGSFKSELESLKEKINL